MISVFFIVTTHFTYNGRKLIYPFILLSCLAYLSGSGLAMHQDTQIAWPHNSFLESEPPGKRPEISVIHKTP